MLRGNARTEKIPIVALTALDSPADCENAFIAGCDDHLQKPLKSEELLAKISSVLRLS
jgi:DNA-binding response OmpR family regulator